jgi:hypothetical protein
MLNCPDRSVDWTHGGQFLHLLWTIEEFLNNLLISGIKFDLIFFESHVALWQDPAMLCFRALLISHLKNNTTITIHLLDDCSQFEKDFLTTANLAFVGLSDGENSPQKDHLRSFYNFCSQFTSCAFISTITMSKGRLIGVIAKQQISNYAAKDAILIEQDKKEKEPGEKYCPTKINDRNVNGIEGLTYNACIRLMNGAEKERKAHYVELK